MISAFEGRPYGRMDPFGAWSCFGPTGEDTMIPESSISPVDELPSYESLDVTEDPSLLRPSAWASVPVV